MKFFKPKWKSENENEALEAIGKIKNINRLDKVSQNASSSKIRKFAYERHKILLEAIHQKDWFNWVSDINREALDRIAAVKHLTDRDLLIKVINGDLKKYECTWETVSYGDKDCMSCSYLGNYTWNPCPDPSCDNIIRTTHKADLREIAHERLAELEKDTH